MNFTETLITSIVKNRDMPKVQVEREIGPILEIFLEAAVNKLAADGLKNHLILEDDGDGKEQSVSVFDRGEYWLVAGEFPLKTSSDNDQSVTIDYLMVHEAKGSDDKTLYFVELKTDSSSFKPPQYKNYSSVIEEIQKEGNSAEFLAAFLDDLVKKNSKYKKYANEIFGDDQGMKGRLPRKFWNEIRRAKLVYLAPARLFRENKRRGKEAMIALNKTPRVTFADLYDKENPITHSLTYDWQVITRAMLVLDEN